jgi:putative glutamine amidotransferase
MLYPWDMKPLIGLNLDVKDGPPEQAQIQANYYRAVEKAGGIAVLVPPMPEKDLEHVLSLLHGVLFIGGDDYCPSNYGEQAHEAVERCHPTRDEFDRIFMTKALEREGMPILGVCAGAQLLNIALGGSLIQDIASEVKNAADHTSKNPWENGFNKHLVKVEEGTEVAKIYKSTKVEVVSSHHQAMRRLGADLVAVAWADDGIVEAIESKTRPFTIGVQWHPERDYNGNVPLFQEFAKRCAQFAASTSGAVTAG